MEAKPLQNDIVSIIVPVSDGLASTRLCLDAIREHTRHPWEIIVINDNASREIIKHIIELQFGGVPITLISNHEFSGFGAACNQGLRSSRGVYIAVVQSDMIVTKGWADHLITLVNADEAIAVAGPMSNGAAARQRVEGPANIDRAALQQFAARWHTEQRGRWFDVERLSGNCLLARREAIEAVRGLDESAPSGFGFDDICIRIRHAGGRLAVAQDVYVHRVVTPSVQLWTRIAKSWNQIHGMFDYELVFDAAVNAGKAGDVFVEIGCMAGRSTCYLGTKIRESGKAIRLYAIDTAQGSPTDSTGREIVPALGGSMAGLLHRNIIGCELEDIVVPIFTASVQAANLFMPESVDFCFIDGDHSYASVTADLHAWWPKIRPGGMIAGHDYHQDASWLAGLTPAVHDFFAVNDATHPNQPHCWAMTKK